MRRVSPAGFPRVLVALPVVRPEHHQAEVADSIDRRCTFVAPAWLTENAMETTVHDLTAGAGQARTQRLEDWVYEVFADHEHRLSRVVLTLVPEADTDGFHATLEWAGFDGTVDRVLVRRGTPRSAIKVALDLAWARLEGRQAAPLAG